MTESLGLERRMLVHRFLALVILFLLATVAAYPLEVLAFAVTGRIDLVPTSAGEVGLLIVLTLTIVAISIRNSQSRIANGVHKRDVRETADEQAQI